MTAKPRAWFADRPVLQWSVDQLRTVKAVRGAFWLAQLGVLGEYVGIVCEDGQGHLLEAQLRKLLAASKEIVTVAAVPDLPRTLAFLRRDTHRLQWGLEEQGTLQPSPRLRESRLLFGGRSLQRMLGASQGLRRGATATSLREVDRLFWIDVSYAADLLERFQGGAAEVVLERLQEHLWAWIDVREMEARLREGTFPRIPEPLWERNDRHDLLVLQAFLVEWVNYYSEVRHRIAAEEGVPLDLRAERVARKILQDRLRSLRDHIR
jgi:hypothetical protein